MRAAGGARWRAAAVLAGVVCSALAGCGPIRDQPRCPATAEQLRGVRDGSFATGGAIPDGAMLAVGVVNRFVASPEAAFRGWDVTIEERVRGLGSDSAYGTLFVRESSVDELMAPEDGDRVLMIGQIEPPALLVPDGPCAVLRTTG